MNLEEARERKFVDACFKKIKQSKVPLPYWYLPRAPDGKPLFLVGKANMPIDPKEILALSGKQNPPGAFKGTCLYVKGDYVFKTPKSLPIDVIKKNIEKIALAAGLSSLSILCSAATDENEVSTPNLQQDEEEGEGEEEIPALTLDKQSWIDFSTKGKLKRSKELKEIDNAFDGVASATDAVARAEALTTLNEAIEHWLAKKEGSSKRLAKVVQLQTEVVKEIRKAHVEQIKALAEAVGPLLAAIGRDLEAELAELNKAHEALDKLANVFDPKVAEAAKKLRDRVGGAEVPRQELIATRKRTEFAFKNILSTATVKLIKQKKKAGESLADNAIYDAMFDDFCAYGRKTFVYNPKAKAGTDLLTGSTQGACASFSKALAFLFNAVAGKDVAKTVEINEKNFYTVALSTVSFIDSKCPGNCRIGKEAEPDRYFYATHFVVEVGSRKFCPTTGTRDGDVDKVVAKAGFIKKDDVWTLGKERITQDKGAGYGGGGLYTVETI